MHGNQWLNDRSEMVIFKEDHKPNEVGELKVSTGGGLRLTTTFKLKLEAVHGIVPNLARSRSLLLVEVFLDNGLKMTINCVAKIEIFCRWWLRKASNQKTCPWSMTLSLATTLKLAMAESGFRFWQLALVQVVA